MLQNEKTKKKLAITLEDGTEVSFEVEWTGKGEIEGMDEDGNSQTLEVD